MNYILYSKNAYYTHDPQDTQLATHKNTHTLTVNSTPGKQPNSTAGITKRTRFYLISLCVSYSMAFVSVSLTYQKEHFQKKNSLKRNDT